MGSFFLLFQGHENKFSIYVHASKKSPAHTSNYFVGRDIHSHKVDLSVSFMQKVFD